MSTVLVVDDEPAILEVVLEFTRTLGHEAVGACDGEEALAVLRGRAADLVITDVMMPRLSGVGLQEAMRADAKLRTIPVLFMSAVHNPPLQEGAPFIRKPFDLDELEAAIAGALATDTPGRPTDETEVGMLRRLIASARQYVDAGDTANARSALDLAAELLRKLG